MGAASGSGAGAISRTLSEKIDDGAMRVISDSFVLNRDKRRR